MAESSVQRRSPTLSPTSSVQRLEVDNNNDKLGLLRTRHRLSVANRYPPPKTTCAALTMLTLGTIFLICGLYVYLSGSAVKNYEGKDRGISMLVLGGLLLCPGSYATFVLFGAWMGWNNFDYSMIPSYDED